MATIASKRHVPPATKSAVHEPKGLRLIALLASLQGLISLGIFARMAIWGTGNTANSLPDPALTSIFSNTDLFKSSLGTMTVGDLSLWVERAVVVGICLAVALLAWRMRSQQ